MSIHTHFSYRTLSRFHNSAFLKKPFSADDLLLQCGVLLNIPEYVQNYYRAPVLTIPVSGQTKIEVAAQTVSYIEVNRKELTIQYMDGRLERFHCLSGAFKALLRQIGESTACPLRQIHRAIVVNPDQIRKVEICGNTGSVWLFNDDNPKPLGIRYRHNLAEYVTDADEEEMRHAAL